MGSHVTDEQLELVRQWAGQGVDLNGIQKRLAAECGMHLTYMEVRFLLLDHGIAIASAPEGKPEESKPAAPATERQEAPEEEPAGDADAPPAGKPVVTLDELQLPGALVSGKVTFPSGTKGAWMIDQAGRFAWNDLEGTPTPAELQAFQFELTRLLSRA